MCVNLSLGDLNPDPCLSNPYFPHLTNIYTYGVTIASRIHGNICLFEFLKSFGNGTFFSFFNRGKKKNWDH